MGWNIAAGIYIVALTRWSSFIKKTWSLFKQNCFWSVAGMQL